MPFALPFPDIGPDIFSINLGNFTFALRWYAMAYIVALVVGWRMGVWLMKRPALWHNNRPPFTPVQVEDLMTWIVLGVVLGGRFGYVVFYQPEYYLAHPAEALMIWQGGMSFHGGLLGVIVAGLWFCRRNNVPIWSAGDAIALNTPLGLALGRVANFINAELWGRPTDVPWGVVFPGQLAQACATVAEPCARHPSQLYEAILEGVLLLAVMWWIALRKGGLLRPGLMVGVFLAGYGAARVFVEAFRQADPHYITADNPFGHVFLGLTMGQILSLPMLIVGLVIIVWSKRRA